MGNRCLSTRSTGLRTEVAAEQAQLASLNGSVQCSAVRKICMFKS
jgi:hypothetical protein